MGHSNIEGKQAARWRPLSFVFCYFHREFRPFEIWALSKSRSIEHFNQLTVINYSRFLHIQNRSPFVIPTFSDIGPLTLLTNSEFQPYRISTQSNLRGIQYLDKLSPWTYSGF